MYNRRLEMWQSELEEGAKLEKCKLDADKDIKAAFYTADNILSKASKGKDTARGVWLMERSAKHGSAEAARAMGQMFETGWGVKLNLKTAARWYERAVRLGSCEAEAELELIRSRMKKPVQNKTDTPAAAQQPIKEELKTEPPIEAEPAAQQPIKGGAKIKLLIAAAAAVAVAAAVLVPGFVNKFKKPEPQGGGSQSEKRAEVIVGENTELNNTATPEEFNDALQELKKEYDDEAVIRGEVSTNRLILCFDGDKLDLSDFLADKVVTRENNRIIIQFSSEEEAQRCLEVLRNTDGIEYVMEDGYNPMGVNAIPHDAAGSGTDAVYTSQSGGKSYNSWGVEDMGMDKLAAYLEKNYNGDEIKVAVIDTGVLPNPGNKGRLCDGECFSVIYGPQPNAAVDSSFDVDGHGTHVAGIVLDATQGLDVKVIPIKADAVGMEENGSEYITLGFSNTALLSAIQYAVDKDADVINMSLGGPRVNADADRAFRYEVLDAMKSGAVVVIASGNETTDTADVSPAFIEECIVVGAHDKNHKIASFSNYGDSVDTTAPGVAVLSYYKGGKKAALPGTSMAAPHISALAAMVKMCAPDASAEQIGKYIEDYCDGKGDKRHFGAGICDASLFAEQ